MQVQADVVNILMDRIDFVNLNLFTCLLPLLTGLMDSKVDRYLFSVSFFFFLGFGTVKKLHLRLFLSMFLSFLFLFWQILLLLNCILLFNNTKYYIHIILNLIGILDIIQLMDVKVIHHIFRWLLRLALNCLSQSYTDTQASFLVIQMIVFNALDTQAQNYLLGIAAEACKDFWTGNLFNCVIIFSYWG